MKKLVLSVITLTSLNFAAGAVTNMCVKTDDGKVVRYATDYVAEVYYKETTNVSGEVDNHAYVDLGLPSGTKWATYNVGAASVTENGDFFAWGETLPKTDYSWSTYKWCEFKKKDNDGIPADFTKYCVDSKYGTTDNKTVLEAECDAATANWGSSWRMPTGEELYELKKGCVWQWTFNYEGSGVAGSIGTSKTNGNTIFLPAFVDYWSSSLSLTTPSEAEFFYFDDSKMEKMEGNRYAARAVRAVLVNDRTYKVNFYGANGEILESQTVKEGEVATEINAPAQDGYMFVGWKDSSFTRVLKNLDIYPEYIAVETVSGFVGGYEYVDLGLSVNWAVYNVGAVNVTETGEFFAWGETSPKKENVPYKWKLYDDGEVNVIKYNSTDSLTILEAEDDAATANWGAKWRMPTNEELTELAESCNWKWVDSYKKSGVAGLVGTSKKNGNTIFLPAAGLFGYDVDKEGFYWSSSIAKGDMMYANTFEFGIEKFNYKNIVSNCESGLSVRPVCGK